MELVAPGQPVEDGSIHMISLLRNEPRFRVPPPYGSEIAPPELCGVVFSAKAQIIDQRDGFIRYANSDVTARKATALYDADVQAHLGQPDGSRGSRRTRSQDYDIMLGGKFHSSSAARENQWLVRILFKESGCARNSSV